MTTIFVVCGKVNYANLSRYSNLSERTYRRHFERGIGFVKTQSSPDRTVKAVGDGSGLHLYGEKRTAHLRVRPVL